MTAGTTVLGLDGAAVVLGEIGTRMLLENSRVRVWEVDLAPGESQTWHQHHNPYVVLCLAASPCRMDWLDGRPSRRLDETVGGSVYRPVGPVHMLTNDGDKPYRNRLIELLDLGEETRGEAQRPTDRPSSDRRDRPECLATESVRLTGGFERPDGEAAVDVPATVVLDEDDVRVQHVTLEPGQSHTWRAASFPALVVDLDLTDRSESVRYLAPGQQCLLAADAAHASGYNLVELAYDANTR